MKKRSLLIVMIMISMLMMLTACGNKSNENKKNKSEMINLTGKYNVIDKIQKKDISTTRKINILKDEILLVVNNNEIKEEIVDAGFYTDVDDLYDYYKLNSLIEYKCKSNIEYNKEKYDYVIVFKVEIKTAKKLLENEKIQETKNEEFFNRYLKNILEENINDIIINNAKENESSIKEVKKSTIEKEINKIISETHPGMKIEIDNITFN